MNRLGATFIEKALILEIGEKKQDMFKFYKYFILL